jgi:hypothetical protein
VLILIAALLFVTTWIGGLVVAGVASAWRSLLWSFEVYRLVPRPEESPTLRADPRPLTRIGADHP